MTTEVVVTLPDTVYQRAVRWAQLTDQDVAIVLSETLARSLPSLQVTTEPFVPVANLDDAAVLELASMELPPEQDEMLSSFLERQQAGDLTEQESRLLTSLMQVYQEELLRKAQALAEAVRRGLQAPLTS